jgi:hypothetical protein
MLALTHGDKKANANSAHEKEPQNSSYKVQLLHAAVLVQSGSNGLCTLVADLIVALQNSCWPSCAATKKQPQIQQIKKTTTKFILQGTASARCCSVAERQQ